ncbi:PAS domain-containing protein [Caulobacter sp. SLTY]|uniref:motility/cell cycle regulatory protein MopJ n=1 Tax=Caulobacter sp. SLTY TaxID=2683262 RepID=UPI001412229F|nr:PAS domain-containing protein [Caulobacter sp. SLTY]NBB16603.1 PAS domain-containing protein [Caulobacter sp. SLTY]
MVAQLGASATAARAHEELLRYWAALRRAGRLPGRADISPDAFKRLLPTVSLIDVVREDGRVDYRQRLAGTGLYSVYGREITGMKLTDLYNSTAADYWRAELDAVVADRKPRVGSHSMAWRGASHVSTLWLRLPLASDGCEVDMILGYDAVIGMQAERTAGISGIRAA